MMEELLPRILKYEKTLHMINLKLRPMNASEGSDSVNGA